MSAPTEADIESMKACLWAAYRDVTFGKAKKDIETGIPSGWTRMAVAALEHVGYLLSKKPEPPDYLQVLRHAARLALTGHPAPSCIHDRIAAAIQWGETGQVVTPGAWSDLGVEKLRAENAELKAHIAAIRDTVGCLTSSIQRTLVANESFRDRFDALGDAIKGER